MRKERRGSRELGGVTVDIKSKIWDSEVAGQGLWRTLAVIESSLLMVLSWHLSILDPCRDQDGGA